MYQGCISHNQVSYHGSELCNIQESRGFKQTNRGHVLFITGNAIRNYTETQLEAGRQREDIAVLEMETLIQEHLYK